MSVAHSKHPKLLITIKIQAVVKQQLLSVSVLLKQREISLRFKLPVCFSKAVGPEKMATDLLESLSVSPGCRSSLLAAYLVSLKPYSLSGRSEVCLKQRLSLAAERFFGSEWNCPCLLSVFWHSAIRP